MTRIATAFALARASWAVLKADKELLLLPVISGAAALTVILSFLVPLVAVTVAGAPSAVPTTLSAVMYLALSYVMIFFKGLIYLG